jgi:hypothetical protein
LEIDLAFGTRQAIPNDHNWICLPTFIRNRAGTKGEKGQIEGELVADETIRTSRRNSIVGLHSNEILMLETIEILTRVKVALQ